MLIITVRAAMAGLVLLVNRTLCMNLPWFGWRLQMYQHDFQQISGRIRQTQPPHWHMLHMIQK